MSTPSFSVCIPNFNYARYIGETIASVLAQAYTRFEVVVADNASTDGSLDAIRAFDDPRIRVHRNRCNIGFAPNLQRVSALATGDFINLLSSDDLMGPHALERYAAVVSGRRERAGRTVLVSDVEWVDGEGRPIGRVQRPFEQLGDSVRPVEEAEGVRFYRGRDVLSESLRRLRNPAPFLSVTYPRALWEEVEGYNAVRTIGPDKFFLYKLLDLDPDVAYVPEVLFRYRFHGSPNAQAQQATLKQQIDDYLYTVEWADAALESLGLRRDDLVRELLDRVCFGASLTQFARGTYAGAVRAWAFGLASYPGAALRRPRFYGVAALLATGPLACPIGRALHRLTRGRSA